MTLSHYVWIYGLAEALVVVVILAIVLGIKWWRLRRERQSWLGFSARIDSLIADELARARNKQPDRPELRDARIATLHALSGPFQDERLIEDQAWEEVVGFIDRCFDGLAQTHSQAPARPAVAATAPAHEAETSAPSEDTDSDIDALLAHYQAGRSTLSSSQSSGNELNQKYQELLGLQDGLMASIKVASKGGVINMNALQQELETFVQSNQAFMQAAHNAERNINLLEQQFDESEERIHNLQVTINNYRKSAHKLVTERDMLQEEKQQFISQLELKEKVIARINRNYETLRREYTKIYDLQ
ncbi:hypothetical protein [Allochromatium palmeri]|uniref:Uncharacterized protein n=1 Tax=Allochromatium palmeri TaxID=231048 RepID=A0A6N8EHT9_9GAMM|nr:hypothetical protein [Allochromatium palmeri]MTW22077.1 hypothetical protein [Allochromatium palmeri]